MPRNRVAGVASILLGAGMMTNALLGPLGAGAIHIRQSPSMETQLLGGEITSLFLAGPLAILGGIAWLVGSRMAPILVAGPSGYALYTYVQFVLVPDYTRYSGDNERWFPLYLTLVILGWTLLLHSLRRVGGSGIAPLDRRIARPLGIALFVMSAVFTLAWIGTIAAALTKPPTQEYLEHATGFWLVRLMDLGFVIPTSLITGYGLLRSRSWSTPAAYASTGVQMLLTCAVAGMAVRMWVRGDPGVTPILLVVSCVGAAVFIAFYMMMVRAAVRFAPSGMFLRQNVASRLTD